jgi:hypothetical protein
MLAIDLKIRFKATLPDFFSFLKALKWLLPFAVFAAKLLIRLHHAGP